MSNMYDYLRAWMSGLRPLQSHYKVLLRSLAVKVTLNPVHLKSRIVAWPRLKAMGDTKSPIVQKTQEAMLAASLTYIAPPRSQSSVNSSAVSGT